MFESARGPFNLATKKIGQCGRPSPNPIFAYHDLYEILRFN